MRYNLCVLQYNVTYDYMYNITLEIGIKFIFLSSYGHNTVKM